MDYIHTCCTALDNREVFTHTTTCHLPVDDACRPANRLAAQIVLQRASEFDYEQCVFPPTENGESGSRWRSFQSWKPDHVLIGHTRSYVPVHPGPTKTIECTVQRATKVKQIIVYRCGKMVAKAMIGPSSTALTCPPYFCSSSSLPGKYKQIREILAPLPDRRFDKSIVRVPYVSDYGTAYVDAYEQVRTRISCTALVR